MKTKLTGFYIAIGISFLVILVLVTGIWRVFLQHEDVEDIRTRIITPLDENPYVITAQSGQLSWDANLETKIPLENGEIVIAVLNRENENTLIEEQFVIYRNTANPTGAIYLTFLSYDENLKGYRRMWSEPTAASRSDSSNLFSQDLIGDRNFCIIVRGMNSNNEHTMTIFRRNLNRSIEEPFNKIADLQIAGSIIIQERSRPLAYQQGYSRGQSYTIAAYGQDSASSNILDQIETIYSFNPSREQYEQTNVSRIPGAQIEQRRLRELLSGVPGVFENFINDLWYFISPYGTIDTKQYLYFDPYGKEIIFFGDEAQQVFQWLGSSYTRFGMSIRSQNISISTLQRSIDIELESLDSIKLRVIEDVRIKIMDSSTSWDGSYRRAGTANFKESVSQIRPTVDAFYDSSWGRIQFNIAGEYSITSSGNVRSGRYVFYRVGDHDLLELRPNDRNTENRMVYKIEAGTTALILSSVRVGTNGIQDLLEPPVTLTPLN